MTKFNYDRKYLSVNEDIKHLHVCLERSKFGKLIEARTGGQKKISSKTYILGLLSQGHYMQLADLENKKSLIIVGHPEDVLNELKNASSLL